MVGCPIFASYFFSLQSETKRNRNRCASFSLRFAKLINKFFALFSFFSPQFLIRFASIFFYSLCRGKSSRHVHRLGLGLGTVLALGEGCVSIVQA